MAININEFLESGLLIIIIALIALIVIVIFLTFVQKKLKSKIGVREEIVQKGKTFIEKINALKNPTKSHEKRVKEISNFSGKIIKEHFQFPIRLDFSEMIDRFNKMKKPHVAKFCDQLLSALYSGDDITKTQIDILIRNLERIIEVENIKPVTSDKITKSVRKIEAKKLPIELKKQKDQIIPKQSLIPKPQMIQRDIIRIQPGTPAPEIKTMKKLPIMPMEIYTVKKEVAQDLPKKKPVSLSDKSIKPEPKSHKKIHNVDDLDRIENKIELRNRLRKEANI